MIVSRGWQSVTFVYCEGDRALAGWLREAVEFPSLEALKECLDMVQNNWFKEALLKLEYQIN